MGKCPRCLRLPDPAADKCPRCSWPPSVDLMKKKRVPRTGGFLDVADTMTLIYWVLAVPLALLLFAGWPFMKVIVRTLGV
jgi:hypothetical protein